MESLYSLLLICKDDLKVCCIIAIFAPIGGILSFGVLFFIITDFFIVIFMAVVVKFICQPMNEF